jgi:uncharacterized protein YhaN
LCQEHGRDLREVVGALVGDVRVPVMVEVGYAETLVAGWRASDAADRGRRRYEQILAEGRQLYGDLVARLHDLEVTGQQLERESDVVTLAALERRREIDEEDYLSAARAWVAFEDAHPEAAAALEDSVGRRAPTAAADAPRFASPTGLRGYEKPDWARLALTR